MSEVEDKPVKKKSGNPAFYKGMPSNNPTGLDSEGNKPKRNPKKQSKLRRTESQLLRLNAKALETIEKSVSGDVTVDKEVLTTCKWVISTTTAVSKAALAEELGIASLKSKEDREDAESSQESEDDEEILVVFSTTMLPTQADLKVVK
jgi:hypothetical protein